MNSNGAGKQRLTYFNDTGYAESLSAKRAIVSDLTWSPDSKTIAILVGFQIALTPASSWSSCLK
jgi:hypothetical protein